MQSEGLKQEREHSTEKNQVFNGIRRTFVLQPESIGTTAQNLDVRFCRLQCNELPAEYLCAKDTRYRFPTTGSITWSSHRPPCCLCLSAFLSESSSRLHSSRLKRGTVAICNVFNERIGPHLALGHTFAGSSCSRRTLALQLLYHLIMSLV